MRRFGDSQQNVQPVSHLRVHEVSITAPASSTGPDRPARPRQATTDCRATAEAEHVPVVSCGEGRSAAAVTTVGDPSFVNVLASFVNVLVTARPTRTEYCPLNDTSLP
jgi:hypothetical protein